MTDLTNPNRAEGFPGGSDGEESVCNVGDLGLITGSGRSPGESNGNPLQYSCLENAMDRGAWRATVHRAAQSQTQLKQLSSSITLDHLEKEHKGKRKGSSLSAGTL